ncbi:MAG: hypothetical protein L6V78_07360 [Clostridium sp.]|nr:MAG: hypothetical protein L6V78_07360 [Clostridium sp.]
MILFLNVIGGVCGYVIFLITKKLLRKYPDALKNNLLLNLLGVITIMVFSGDNIKFVWS